MCELVRQVGYTCQLASFALTRLMGWVGHVTMDRSSLAAARVTGSVRAILATALFTGLKRRKNYWKLRYQHDTGGIYSMQRTTTNRGSG
jgi:hypothetical protein